MSRRKTPGVRWCWLSKDVLGRIRERVEQPATAIAVYAALCEISSDKNGASTFQASAEFIAGKTGLTGRSVRSVLPALEAAGAIRIARTEGVRVANEITIVDGQKEDNPLGNRNRNLLPPIEERDKRRNTPHTPRGGGDLQSGKHKETGQPRPKKPKQPMPPLPPELDTPDAAAAWAEFQQHRKELRKPLTPTACARILARWAPKGPAAFADACRRSVENGWQGLFDPPPNHRNGQAAQRDWTEAELLKHACR